MTVRFRTIGDMTCTGAVESNADNLEKIIDERTGELKQQKQEIEEVYEELRVQNEKIYLHVKGNSFVIECKFINCLTAI